MRAAHVHAVSAALEGHAARVDWTREQLDRHRDERLRSLLGLARERSSFHAARLTGVDPDTASIADLARIEPMTKADAQQQWDAIVTVPYLSRAGAERTLAEQEWFSYTPTGEQLFSSGGSTGVRGVYVWGWEQFISLACLAWRMQVRDEMRANRPSADARMAVLSAALPPHASTPLFDVPTRPGMETAVIAAGDPFDQVLAAVKAFGPTHLVGYASVIGRLARATLDGVLDIRPVRVSTNSEPLSEEDRDAILAAWGAPIHNLWGSTEIGVQAVGCGQGEGLHVCEDEVVLERVDADGNPVASDQPAVRTLATGLAGTTFPFIRYDLGDEVTMLTAPCPCGSRLVRVAAVAGRRDDDFRYGSQTVPASSFRHVLGSDPAISEYQVQQTPAGAMVLVVGSPQPAALAAALASAVGRHGLADPEICVRLVPAIERHASTGKLRRFIPLAGGA